MSEGWKAASDRDPLTLVAVPLPNGPDRPRPAVFLDRDGVVNELVADPLSGDGESPLSIADVRLAPGAARAAIRLARAGYALVCVSNQPAAAKRTVPVTRLLAVHERVIELLGRQGALLDASYLCPHHPDGTVAELSGRCECRKPNAGMLLAAADALRLDLKRSWMVGDTDADIGAGVKAGCRTLLVRNPGSVHKRLQALIPDLDADSLLAGVERLLAV